MSIRLLSSTLIYGVDVAADGVTTITLSPSLEDELVAAGRAVRVNYPSTANSDREGIVVWNGNNRYGTSTSGGANLPTVSAVDDGLLVVTPVTNWCELTLPPLRSARLLPLNLVLDCDSPDWASIMTISYYIGTAGFSNFWTRTWQATTTGVSAGPEIIGAGKRSLYSEQSIMPVGGGAPVFGSTLVDTHKIRITPVPGSSAKIVLNRLRYDVDDAMPSLSICFDDGYSTVINNALPILLDRGLKASMGVISDAIGSSTRYCTLDQLRKWRMANQACITHGPLGLGAIGNLSEYSSVEEAVADMTENRKFLRHNGLVSRGEENFYVWPQGIRSMGGSLRDVSLIEAAEKAGFVAARGTLYNHTFNPTVIVGYPQRFDIPIIGHSKDYGGDESANITNLLAKIDALIDGKASGCLLFHDVGASPTNVIDITTENFTTLMNRVALRVSQGLLKNPFIFDQVPAA